MKEEKQNIATSEELNTELERVMSDDFYLFLVKYSIKRLNNVFNLKYNIDRGIRGITVEDMIHKTLESLISGSRKWNKDKFDDIKKQILSSLDSVISNTIKTDLAKDNVTFEILENDNTEIIEDNEYNNLIEICEQELKKAGATDEEVLLFEPYIVQGMKRQDLANLFGISLNELSNIKKRLSRKIPLLKVKLKELRYEK